MLKPVEQRTRRRAMWLGDFQPTLEGDVLSWPAWSAQLGTVTIEVPAGEVTLEHDKLFTMDLRMWLVPSPDDGYLHLDLAPDRPGYEHVEPVAWPRFGAILLVWGTVPAKDGEPALSYLHQVEVKG